MSLTEGGKYQISFPQRDSLAAMAAGLPAVISRSAKRKYAMKRADRPAVEK